MWLVIGTLPPVIAGEVGSTKDSCELGPAFFAFLLPREHCAGGAKKENGNVISGLICEVTRGRERSHLDHPKSHSQGPLKIPWANSPHPHLLKRFRVLDQIHSRNSIAKIIFHLGINVK